jgi:CDP-diacylglycerol pyrophosphatase
LSFVPAGVALRLIAAVLVSLAAAAPAHADRMALWTIVHGQCVPHVAAGEGPKPCERVDLTGGEEKGVALLKDLRGVAQYLAIPTRRITGIEDPLLLAPDAPNYFAYAWANRDALEAKLGRTLPREAIGISINSQSSRSQDQMHLHIDCMDKDVIAALAADKDAIDSDWRMMTTPLKGRRYWARRLDSADLADVSPLRLLADGIEGAKALMAFETLIAVGADFGGKPGFILLAGQAGSTGGGHAEDLQDHDCKIP